MGAVFSVQKLRDTTHKQNYCYWASLKTVWTSGEETKPCLCQESNGESILLFHSVAQSHQLMPTLEEYTSKL
jgi:hypothetical protein